MFGGRRQLAGDRGERGFVQVMTLQGQHCRIVLLAQQFAQIVDEVAENRPMLVEIGDVGVEGAGGWEGFHGFRQHGDPQFAVQRSHLDDFLKFDSPLKNKFFVCN